MLGLAFVAVGSFYRRSFASASIRFRPSGSFIPCADVLSSCGDFFVSLAPRGFPFFSLPPFRRAGWGGEGLEVPLCCFPRVFLSSRSTFVQREEWTSLWSLVWCTRARFCLLGSFVDWGSRSCSLAADSCYLLCCGWLSLLIYARPARWWGGRVFGGLLCSRLPLPPHLCTPCEVMRRESLRSSAPVRVPPWLPDLRLGEPGGCFEPALGRMALVTGLVAHAVAPLSVNG